jgi:putative ABC transport system permease protein
MMYLISLGLGLEKLTLGAVAQSNTLLTLTVRAGSVDLRPLTPKSIETLSKISKVKSVLPKLVVKGEVSLNNQRAPVTINGVEPAFLDLSDDTKISSGRLYRQDDLQTMIVSTGFLNLFGLDPTKTPLVSFDVTLDPHDNPGVSPLTSVNVSGVITSDAAIMYLPRPYLETAIKGKVSSYESAKVQVASLDDIESVSSAIINQGFKVESVIDTVQEIKKVFKWIRIVLGGLGFIAIIVSTIGMFNTLTISLLERTKEIGIMKALGVKGSDISRLFLSESLLMGLIGGLVGIGMAFLAQQLTLFCLTLLASFLQGKVPAIFENDAYVVALFLVFSMGIAGITGIYPARRATRINPIEAIRYE